jgi:hypothetical protein
MNNENEVVIQILEQDIDLQKLIEEISDEVQDTEGDPM